MNCKTRVEGQVKVGLAEASTDLTRREIDILVGLAVQADLDLALPKPAVTRKHMRKTDALMEELHSVIGDPLGSFFRAGATGFGEALREPIIYGPESAYESQYLDLAVERYSADNGWLRHNRGLSIEDAVSVVNAVVEVRSRAMEAALRGLRNITPGRRNLLAAFIVGVGEVATECGLGLKTVSAVLNAFVLRGGNADFATVSDFNAAVEALFQSARGLPRLINRIAHYAMTAAALNNARTVNAEHLEHAVAELRL